MIQRMMCLLRASLVLFLVSLVSAYEYSADGLNWRANGVWRYFGTVMNGGVPGDKAMNALATNTSDFGQYTCEYQMKFGYTEPQRNT